MRTLDIWAHRGASHAAGDNTREAFALAKALGAHGVELDVRRSADGQPVVVHDAHYPDGRLVVDVALDDRPSTVLTLDEALDACGDVEVNVEIKNHPVDPDFDASLDFVDRVVALLARRSAAGRADRVVVSSFHVGNLDRVAGLDASLPIAVLTMVDPDAPTGVRIAAERGWRAVHPHVSAVDADLVAAAHDAGVELNVWTVDDPVTIRRLAELGVDGVITNVPDVARDALARPGPG